MKKCLMLLLMTALLTGCGAEATLETVTDELLVQVMAQPGTISVELPGETAMPVIENQNGRLYVCNDYEIMIQTMESGDLNQTMEAMSGHRREEMTVMETFFDGVSRYEFVWATAGEDGDQTGRAVILDDGSYHYCMSVLCDADSGKKSQINWNQVFSSFSLT